jgi:hypothetical protein
MKTPINDHEPPPDWVEQAVQAHLATRLKLPEPSPEFRSRCRVAALGAFDVLKMQQHRQQLARAPGSLCEHFEALARAAGVKLEGVFKALGIAAANTLDAANVRGLAQLAQHLGLACEEVVLRVRWEVAQLAGMAPAEAWAGANTSGPARRRAGSSGHTKNPSSTHNALLVCERSYHPARRAQLRAALAAVEEVYAPLNL